MGANSPRFWPSGAIAPVAENSESDYVRIPVKALLELKEEVAMHKSLKEGVVPTDWKLANIAPIFKKGNKDKMRGHGITGLITVWIKNWLLDCLQRVVLNGCFSSWIPVTSGVPQVSVLGLGPILFIVYVH